ncbi:MAG: Crp/Fnr family transcriptional regulator [Cyclobacteriaceae bacterium]|nr:Crp/Fnr family transcriptional regulator [Cyclobacteriaceae bacterium]
MTNNFSSEILIKYFDDIERLSEFDKTLLRQHIKATSIKKGRYFLENGQKSNKIGFVVQGVLRLFEYNEYGNEISHCYIKENGFITDPTSFFNQTITSKYIITETNCDILTFDYSAYLLFGKQISKWHQIIQKATEQSLSSKITEKTNIIMNDGTLRYINFVKKHPDIVSRVSLKSIANYLGLTKYSVSRIRKKNRQE